MILKRKPQNTLALSFTLFILLFLSPVITKSQNTIPSTTVTGILSVDSTMTSSDLIVSGTGRIDSSLVVNDTMHAQDIVVSGGGRIGGNINLGGKLIFDATNSTGFGFKTGSTSGTGTFLLGRVPPTPLPLFPVPCAASAQTPLNFNIGAALQIFDQSNPTTSGILNIQTWPIGSSIDASVGSVTGNQGLLINYFCGNNTIINCGANGGAVYVGNDFYAGKNVQIGNPGPALDPNVSLNVFLNGTTSGLKLWSGAIPTVKLIHDNYDQFIVMGTGKTSIGVNSTPGAIPYRTLTVNGDASFANYGAADGNNAFEILGNNQIPTKKGISVDNNPSGNINFFINSTTSTGAFKFKNGTGPTYDLMTLDELGKLSTITYGSDAFEIKNFGSGTVNFIVKANGATYIGARKPLATGVHQNALLAVDGKAIATSFYVTNAGGIWADYVFEKNYKCLSLEDLDIYLKENKHLPGVVTAKEVELNGLDLGTTQAKLLEKLEESYLYIIELNKRIEALEKKEPINERNKNK